MQIIYGGINELKIWHRDHYIEKVLKISEDITIQKYIRLIRDYHEYTYAHSVRVAAIACELGQRLGVEEEEQKRLCKAALLHDIGKIEIRKDILDKPERLTTEERKEINLHPLLGYKILERDIKIENEVKEVVLQHHERNDKTGYPSKLIESNISFFSKIVAVADVYDAMISRRVYKDPIPVNIVANYFIRSETLYDKRVINCLNSSIINT